MVNVGDLAPDFALPDGQGRTVQLSEFRGKQRVVVYFFPKAHTPGCDAEARAFRANYPTLQGSKVQVLGISTDPPEVTAEYRTSFDLPYPVLSDASKEVSRNYGVLRENGMARRVSFHIDPSGRVTDIVDDKAPDPHVERTLASCGATPAPPA
jgi:peroxiredoxin Q/BCP